MSKFCISEKTGTPIAINIDTKKIIRLKEIPLGLNYEKELNDDVFDYIPNEEFTKYKKKMTVIEKNQVKYALQKQQSPNNHLDEIYNQLKTKYEDNCEKEYKIYEGQLMPLPTPKKADRIYISGATGVGKSYWVEKYVQQFKRIYPDKKVFLFSDVPPEDDHILGKLNPIRIQLNQELVVTPIQPKELENSVVIFDDVDSISDKKIREAVVVLYSAILKMGSSKHSITLIVTNHQMSDYRYTRDILLNSNFIVFFTGSKNGVEYTLKKLGISKENIYKLMNLPSRSVCLMKNYPMYAVYDAGIFLLE